jgi:hypothetical protein
MDVEPGTGLLRRVLGAHQCTWDLKGSMELNSQNRRMALSFFGFLGAAIRS